MAKRGSGKAVGYIRGRLWKGKWAPDKDLQARRIKEFAEEYEYEIIHIAGEQQKFLAGLRAKFSKFHKLLDLCKEHEADFLYVDIGNWRPNVVLNAFVTAAKSGQTKRGWKFVAVPPDKKTMEAIERQARMEKFELQRRRRKKPAEKKSKTLSPIEKWQIQYSVGSRRLKGFEHLYHGVDPIFRIIEKLLKETSNLTNKRIAWALDREAYLTVDGKRWTDETVRKVRGLIKREEFRRYVRLRNIDDEQKFDD